jgi:mannosyl-3-phosphoglycerate phosphatase family protein
MYHNSSYIASKNKCAFLICCHQWSVDSTSAPSHRPFPDLFVPKAVPWYFTYRMRKTIIFSDLDGTLLDEKYSFSAALPALRLIEERNTPLILCSSKTRTEIEAYRARLGNRHPFIPENGGGIFVPKGYFRRNIYITGFLPEEEASYHVIRLGAKYAVLREAIEGLRREGFRVKGFGDMTVEGITALTGLSSEEAAMSKERDFDEPFIVEDTGETMDRLVEAIEAKGLRVTQGRLHHILGDSDKGKAVTILSAMYRKRLGRIVTIAIGDSPNDLPMLRSVDLPVLVRKSDGSHDQRIDIPNLVRADGVGPGGWNDFLLRWLQSH